MTEIKFCTKSHVPAICEIVLSCSNWLASQGMDHWKNYYTTDMIISKYNTTHVAGIFEENVLKGVISLSSKTPSYYLKEDFQNPDDKAIYLGMLAVKPEFHKKGLATKLMNFSESYALSKNFQVSRLMYFANYKELGEFYSKRGYSLIRTRDDDGDLISFCEKKLVPFDFFSVDD